MRKQSRGAPAAWSSADLKAFRLRRFVLNRSEAELFAALVKHCPIDRFVHAKVRVEDIISASGGRSASRQSARNRIKSRHFDFLLTDIRGTPICVIELDGPHHRSRGYAKADRFKNDLCERVGLELVRVSYKASYKQAALSLFARL